jgi:hypothetical protein
MRERERERERLLSLVKGRANKMHDSLSEREKREREKKEALELLSTLIMASLLKTSEERSSDWLTVALSSKEKVQSSEA